MYLVFPLGFHWSIRCYLQFWRPLLLSFLPPATAETTKLELQSAIVRSGCLCSPVICMATRVVVKMAHELSIPCSLAAFPGYRNFFVTVAIRRPATDLIARQLVTCVSTGPLPSVGVLPLQAAAAAT